MPKTITIEISNSDWKVLEHDLLDPEAWVREAVAGKIVACAKRLAVDARRTLESDPAVDTMPAKPGALIAEYMKRPDYKDRKARDAEERRQRARVEIAPL